MGNRSQLSAGEPFDDFTGQPLGEGYLTLQSSAGNRVVFRSPAEMWNYVNGNPGQFAGTPNSSGDYSEGNDPV